MINQIFTNTATTLLLLRHHQHDTHEVRTLWLDKDRHLVDFVKAGFLFLRHCVFELGGPLCTWQKRLPDDPKSVASCGQCRGAGWSSVEGFNESDIVISEHMV